MEFGEAAARFLASQSNLNTRRTYGIALTATGWAGRDLGTLTRSDLEGFESRTMARPVSANTRWHALVVVKAFLKWAAAHDLTPLRSDMVRKVHTPDAPGARFLSEPDLQRLLMALDDPRDAALIRVMAGAGLRVSEALSLTSTSLERGESGYRLRVLGKGARVRVVPIHPDLGERLAALGDGPLFRSRDRGGLNRPLTVTGARYILHRACARAGINHVNPHALRHTFAFRTYRASKDVMRVKRLLGHSNLSMTMRYVDHFEEAELREAIPAL